MTTFPPRSGTTAWPNWLPGAGFGSKNSEKSAAINCRCSSPSTCSRRLLRKLFRISGLRLRWMSVERGCRREACGAEPSTIKAMSEDFLPPARPSKAMNADRSVLAFVKIAQSATIGTRKARCHQVKRAWLRSIKASVDRLTRSRSFLAWSRRRARRAGLITRGVLRFMVFSCCV